MTIERVAIVGLGLIGGSVGLAVQQMLPGMTTTGWDADPDVRQRAAGRRLVGGSATRLPRRSAGRIW